MEKENLNLQTPDEQVLKEERGEDAIKPPDTKESGFLMDALALLPAKTILDETRLAGVLGVTPRTIRRMVSRFELPPPVSLAGRSVWLAGRVIAYIEAAAERAERAAKERARKISEYRA